MLLLLLLLVMMMLMLLLLPADADGGGGGDGGAVEFQIEAGKPLHPPKKLAQKHDAWKVPDYYYYYYYYYYNGDFHLSLCVF
jgi:hypothetical protein